MKLLDVLMGEHRGFSSMLNVLESVASRVQAGGDVPAGMLDGLLDFFEHLTDGHHLQEEQLLFPILAEHGIGRDQSVVNALLAQHEAGRMYTCKMRSDVAGVLAGEPAAREQLAAHAHGYVELIREHIRIEDSYFYRVAEEILSHAENEAITQAFRQASSSRVPAAEIDRYLRMMTDYPDIVAGWQAAGLRS